MGWGNAARVSLYVLLVMPRVFLKTAWCGCKLLLEKRERHVAGYSAAEVTATTEKGVRCESNKEEKAWSLCTFFSHFCVPHMNKPL